MLIPNEKRILTLMARRGRLSKKEIARATGLGWATIVKLVGRLERNGYLLRAGILERPSTGGVKPESYTLSGSKPLAIGIDVEYTHSRAILTNLKLEELHSVIIPTPSLKTREDALDFIETLCASFIQDRSSFTNKIMGIGIGFPTWLLPEGHDAFPRLEEELNSRLRIPVRIDNNIRAYTVYKQISHPELQNFVLITIRSGIGVGIVIGGVLYRGEQGRAGEISHFILVREGGNLCRCGKHGCLETVLNQTVLAEQYGKKIANRSTETYKKSEQIHPERIFEETSLNDPVMQDILEEAAKNLAYPLSALLLTLNIDTVFIAGHFESHGPKYVDLVKQYTEKWAYPHSTYSFHYEDIQDAGFPLGAAMMVLAEFCDFSLGNDAS